MLFYICFLPILTITITYFFEKQTHIIQKERSNEYFFVFQAKKDRLSTHAYPQSSQLI